MAAACIAGCGGSDAESARPEPQPDRAAATASRPGAIPLAPAPAAVSELCRAAATTAQLACPGLFPARGDPAKIRAMKMTRDTYAGYLLDFNVSPFRGDDLGHVLLGAQPGPLAVRGAVGETWPRRRADVPNAELRLPARTSGPRAARLTIVRRVRVGEADALVLRSPTLPAGGIHAGHVIVLWNLAGHGYSVSLHLTNRRKPERYTQRERMRAAVRVARSYVPYSG